MEWSDRKNRIRRFLRDPDSTIWQDALLMRLYNDEQLYIQNAASLLENVQAVRVPPLFETSYLYAWEWEFASPANGYVYQALNIYDQADMVFTYWWEPELIAGASSDTSDSGSHFTHPWEAFVTTPSDTPPLWCPNRFQKIIAMYWDKEPIDPTTKKEITRDDRTWRTRTGDPQKYRRLDALENFIALYPTPSSVVWNDDDGDGVLMGRYDSGSSIVAHYDDILELNGVDQHKDLGSSFQGTLRSSFTFSFRILVGDGNPASTEYILGSKNASAEDYLEFHIGTNGNLYFFYSANGVVCTCSAGSVFANGANEWKHVVGTYDAENNIGRMYVNSVLVSAVSAATLVAADYTSNDEIYVGALNTDGTPGSFFAGKIDGLTIYNECFTQAQVTEDFVGGIIYDASGAMADGDGIGMDIVDADDNLLMAYVAAPTEIKSDDDEGDIPQFLCKYIEHAVLERAFQANTDGKAESLENYWALRREIGEKAIMMFKHKRRVDRDYCLRNKGAPAMSTRRHPRLPDAYPAVW